MVLYIIVGILCLSDFTTFLLPVSFIHTLPGHDICHTEQVFVVLHYSQRLTVPPRAGTNCRDHFRFG